MNKTNYEVGSWVRLVADKPILWDAEGSHDNGVSIEPLPSRLVNTVFVIVHREWGLWGQAPDARFRYRIEPHPLFASEYFPTSKDDYLTLRSSGREVYSLYFDNELEPAENTND